MTDNNDPPKVQIEDSSFGNPAEEETVNFVPTLVRCMSCKRDMAPADVNMHGCVRNRNKPAATWLLTNLLAYYDFTLDARTPEQAAKEGFKAGETAAREAFVALLKRQMQDAKKRAKRQRDQVGLLTIAAQRSDGFAEACEHVLFQLDSGGEDDE